MLKNLEIISNVFERRKTFKHCVWIFNECGNNRCIVLYSNNNILRILVKSYPGKSYRVKEDEIFLDKSHKKSVPPKEGGYNFSKNTPYTLWHDISDSNSILVRNTEKCFTFIVGTDFPRISSRVERKRVT